MESKGRYPGSSSLFEPFTRLIDECFTAAEYDRSYFWNFISAQYPVPASL